MKDYKDCKDKIAKGVLVMLYGDITEKVIACCMTVHKTLGVGFQTYVYQKALAIEMRRNGVLFEREKRMDVFYQNEHIGESCVDFTVENKVILTIKTVKVFEPIHIAQALNHLDVFKMRIGLLINFGDISLKFKRVHNNNLNGE